MPADGVREHRYFVRRPGRMRHRQANQRVLAGGQPIAPLERGTHISPRLIDKRACRSDRYPSALAYCCWKASLVASVPVRPTLPLTFVASSSSTRRPMPHAHAEWHMIANPMTPIL